MTLVLDSPAMCRDVRRFTVHPAWVVGPVGVWVTTILLLDSEGSRSLQRGLGIATWIVLLAVLSRATPLVRAQALVVVAFATVVEYTFSPVLGVYTYRFDNVPMYVPPGHGLVYVAALAIGELVWVRNRLMLLRVVVVVAGGAYAAYGVLVSARPDALGVFWYACLVGFLFLGPSPGLYVGAFVVVTYLELLGTSVGTWTWHAHDPTGIVSIGNPPSGAAGGYGWFDLAALFVGRRLLAGWKHQRTP